MITYNLQTWAIAWSPTSMAVSDKSQKLISYIENPLFLQQYSTIGN